MSRFHDFIREHGITEVECLVPDMNGVARGKILPGEKFLKGLSNRGMRIPESIFVQTITGNWSFRFNVSLKANRDLKFDYEQRSQVDALDNFFR